MKLKKIKLKNIRSYEEQEFNFPDGSLLLSGDVGSGKTSVLLAIEYAFFGLQPGQTGSALLRNNCAVGEGLLELEIEGRNIVIERKLKKGQKSIVNDYASITIDGEKEECSITELKTRILNILAYPPEFIKKNNLLYKYTVYTPQEQMKQIILEDPETRLNVLRHVFGIDKYKIIRENLGLVLAKLKDEIKFLQMYIKTFDQDKSKIEAAKERVKIIEGQMKEKEKERVHKIERIKSCEAELSALEGHIKEKEKLEVELEKTKVLTTAKNENFFQVKREIAELQRNLQESGEQFEESSLKEIMQKILTKRMNLDNLNEQHIEIASQIKNLEQSGQELLIKKNRVFSIDICPTCLQDVPEAHKHNILNDTERTLVEINKKFGELMNKKEESVHSIEKEKIDLIQLESRKNALEILKSKQESYERTKKKLAELLKTKELLEKDILMLEKHLETTKQDVLQFFKFHNLYKLKQDELKSAFVDEKNSEISLAELKKEIEITNKEILILEKELAEKESSKKKLAEHLGLVDWLSNQFMALINLTERNVMIKLRNEFSKLFGKWFHMLAGEIFDTQLDENFTPLIMQGEFEMDYSFLSGGERTAVALAYRLALNQTINSIMSQIKTRDIIILDEPTDGFSEAQIDKIRDVFEELNVGQLIIVSHEQKIENFVDNVLRLKKAKDISNIETMPNLMQ